MLDLIVIKSYEQAHLADLDRAKLNAEGIECFLKVDNTISEYPFLLTTVSGIKLIIHKSDIEKVKSVLGTNKYYDLICPYCGSVEVQQKISIFTTYWFLFLSAHKLEKTTKKYLCTSCKHVWKSE